jgi:hypothetical protein
MFSSDTRSRVRSFFLLLLIALNAVLAVQAFQTVVPLTRKSACPPVHRPERGHTPQPDPP